MKYLKDIILAIITVLAPIKATIIVVLLLIIADLITGIMAAYKRGEQIDSSGIKRTIGKIFLYELAVILTYLSEKYLLGDLIPAMKIVCAIIGLTELKSIFENINSVQGRPVFEFLLDKIVQAEKNPMKKKVVKRNVKK